MVTRDVMRGCRDGVSRIGMYCTLSHCWERLNSDGEVDVFTAAKTVMMNRPRLMNSLVSRRLYVPL